MNPGDILSHHTQTDWSVLKSTLRVPLQLGLSILTGVFFFLSAWGSALNISYVFIEENK